MCLLLSISTGLLAYDFKVGDLCYNITNDTLAPYSVEITRENENVWKDSTAYSNLPSSVIIQESVIYNKNSYNVTNIGRYAFLGCTGLTSITIPNSVTSIGEYAFYGCAGLTSITIPNSVTWIGDDAFSGCTGLTSITIPNSVTSIGDGAFSRCTGLISITIPNSVTSIGESAFSGCTGLTSITIPNSVTSIGGYAFYRCTGLTSITIPNSVTSIGGYAFYRCTGLTSITIPNSVTSIGDGAFLDVPNIVYYGTATGSPWGAKSMNGYVDGYLVYEDDTRAKLLACSTAATGEIIIPNSVTSIGSRAFLGCTGLTSITIPNSVTSIGSSAFSYCTGLTSVVWNAKHCADLTDTRSPFYYYDNTYYGDIRPQITSFVFGDGVQHIPAYLCNGMGNLTSITIPNSVTSIGSWAFSGCTGLASITIPNSVTEIGWYAFEYSRMHKFVCMNPDVEFYVKPRFSYALDTIIAPARLLDVEESEWLTQPKYLKHAELTNGEMTDNVCHVLNRSYKTLLTLDLKGVSNTTIADEAFKGCYNLKTLRLPAQLTKVPYMAVADCKSLQEITIPATVEEIDNSAFENCRSIRSITFEGAVAPQGAAQYAPTTGCALWRIGNWAFYNCHELQNLLIPEGVTEIGDAAFYGCVYLQDMVLPGTIETIGDNAFALCSKLQKITVLSTTPPTIEAKTFYDVNRAIPVYVPAEAVADYKNDRYWKEFNIQSNATAIEQTSASNITPCKVFRDGQVYILRGGKTYTLTGVEVNL